MVLICPPIYSAQGRNDFNRLLERLGGKALDLRAVRNRRQYLDSLSEEERAAYSEGFAIWSRELGDPKAVRAYLDGRDLARAKLLARGTTRADLPHDLPGEGSARLSPAAQERRQEMREAIDRTAAQILPKAASVRLVENIRIADGKAEARALAYRLRKGEIKDVDFTTKQGKNYFAHFSARDDEGNLFVQVFPPDAVPAKPAKGGKPEQPGTPSAAHIYLDYMGPTDPQIHGFSGPRYEVGLIHTERGHRRLGIASALYDTIEKALGVKLVPSGLLLPDGYKFWQSRNPELLRGYAQEGDSWISPRQIRLGLDAERKNLTEAIADGKLDKIEKYKASVAQYEAWWKAVPQDLKAQNKLDAMFALRSAPSERDNQVVTALRELAKHDEIFAYRKADRNKRALKGIFADVAPEMQFVRSEKATGEAAEYGAERIHHFKTEDGRDFRIYDNASEVWIDVSELRKGGAGSAVYAAVGNYAFNTGREFIGDPAGISDIALRRRTEQMLSSALKFGTTEHLRPHPEQVAGRPDLGISPLKWTFGDDNANLAALVHASIENISYHVPEIRNARFDFATGTFRTGQGEPISDGMFRAYARRSARIRASGAGIATLKRAILQSSLLQEAGREGGLGLLDQILQLTSQLDQPKKALGKTFYSLSGEVEALGRTDPYTMTISLAARAIEAEARARGVGAGEQAEKVLRHEGVEFFKALGLINDREWSVLESAARREGWVDETGVREPYSELYHEGVMSRAELEQVLIKEAIAEKYSEFHLGRREFPGMIGQVFTRIKDFLTRAMNALRGMGFQKWEDVFDRIDRGEFKQRFEGAFGNLHSPNAAPDQLLALSKTNRPDTLRGFFSPAIRAVESITQQRGTGEQFWKQITKVPGVKKDELDWMGLEEFLKDKPSVTKAEVLDFMRAHQVDLDEKVLGGAEAQANRSDISIDRLRNFLRMTEDELPDRAYTDIEMFTMGRERAFVAYDPHGPAGGGWFALDDSGNPMAASSREQAIHMATGLVASESEVATKFADYKVPGGTGYRELLIRLPALEGREKTPTENARIIELNDRIVALQDEIFASPGSDAPENVARRQGIDRLSEERDSIIKATKSRYTSKHFQDQELVHLRVDDRTGPNGEKVLFINEVQSDLHQMGRQRGYKGGLGEAKARQALNEISEITKSDFQAWADAKAAADEADHSSQSWDKLQAEAKEARSSLIEKRDVLARERGFENYLELQQEDAADRVPNAPFKGDLWLELALKRALQYATENGYDAVSWARSDQIARAVGAEPEKLTLQYDQKIGKFYDKYTRKWGGKVGEERKIVAPKTSTDAFGNEYPNWTDHGANQILPITPEMRASVQREGQPLFALRQQPSLLDQTFADIRAELGLEMPKTAWKGNKTPSARQQLIAIATAGGEQVLRLHGETMAPWLAANRTGLERMALPLSIDPIGDGFNLFWREFVLRPDNLRQTHGQLYNDFADILDAETPHLLESIDKMHTIGREQLAERRAAAAAGGAGGRVPPAGPPPLPASGSDRWPKIFRRFADSYKRTFQPELVSNAAFEADPLFAAYRAGSAQEKDMIIARGEELYQLWRKQPEAARLQFLKDVDAGAAQPTPQLAEIAYRYRQLLDRAYRDEVAYGSKAAYIEDYMPRLFEKEKDVEQFLASRTAALGPTWFQKHRHYDLLEEALAAGHKLKTTNPEELVALRLMAGADMRQRMELLMALERMGLARRVKDLQQAGDLRADAGDGVPILNENDGFARAGWKAINAPNREQWLLSPDIQPLWQNAVEAQGFWQHPGAAGSIFRGWMMFKNAWVPIKLTLSAFHPLHVLHINVANDLARGFSQARGGDLRGALESFVDAFTPTQGVGYEARHAWAKRPEERTPQEQGMVDMMVEGGFSPQLSEQLRVAAKRNLQEAMDKGWKKSGQIALHGLRFAIEKMQSRIFEHWIPGLKAAAYIKEAQALFERRPDLLDDATKRRVALRAIAKSVDNRFGEMFYSTLFWDRYVKDAGIGSFLSLGWNLGFVREFGGAAVESVSRQFTPSLRAKETVREVTNKRAFAFLYISTAMLINGVMSWGLSGEAPDEFMDFIFPRIGGKNPDGSKRRITNMFYTRELPMLTKHMQEQGGGLLGSVKGAKDMLWNKMMFQPFFEIWENRSYWGYEIYDPDSPFYQQAAQLVGYAIGDQLSPITFGGAQRARDLSGSWWDKSVPMSFLGFGPAPAYAERSALENRIRHYYTEFVAPLKKPYAAEELADERRRAIEELKLARLKGDVEGAAKAKEKAIAAGAKSKYLTKSRLEVPTTFYLFSKLPEETQRHLLREMSPSDRNNYRKFAKQKLRREFPAIVGSGEARPTIAQPEPAEAH